MLITHTKFPKVYRGHVKNKGHEKGIWGHKNSELKFITALAQVTPKINEGYQ